MRPRRDEVGTNADASRGFTKKGYPVGVAVEVGNVVFDPLDGQALVP